MNSIYINLLGDVSFGSINYVTKPYLLYPIIGYRITPKQQNKINFRIYAEPPFSGNLSEDILFIPIGLSLGLNF